MAIIIANIMYRENHVENIALSIICNLSIRHLFPGSHCDKCILKKLNMRIQLHLMAVYSNQYNITSNIIYILPYNTLAYPKRTGKYVTTSEVTSRLESKMQMADRECARISHIRDVMCRKGNNSQLCNLKIIVGATY
jgi:hypothetical protein